MSKKLKEKKKPDALRAHLANNRRAFGHAGPLKNRRKEAFRKWARNKSKTEV